MSAAVRFTALRRRLGPLPDPIGAYAEYAAVADGPSALFAGEDGSAYAVLEAGLRISGRGRVVCMEALTPGHATLLAPLAARLRARGAVTGDDRALRFEPANTDPTLDEDARLLEPSPFDLLRALLLDDPALAGVEPADRAALGLISYDMVDAFEALPPPRAPSPRPALDLLVPSLALEVAPGGRDATLVALVPEATAPSDRARAQGMMARAAARLAAPLATPTAARPCVAHADLDDADFSALVAALQDQVRAGEVFQVVASRAFRAPCPDPLAAFRRLAALNPSRHAFHLAAGDRTLFGCSPETALRVDGANRKATLMPIAGTRPRSRDAAGAIDTELDARLLAELHLDAKELAEHLMLVDLARNDLARICVPGTRRVSDLLRTVLGSHVMHLASTVDGRLRDGLDALHAYAACANMGTLTGAPKLRAMELLREHEPESRAAYGGAFGLLRGDGSFDSAIVIRSAEVVDGTALVRAGAGIVLGSEPQREADETRRKAAAVLAALGAAA